MPHFVVWTTWSGDGFRLHRPRCPDSPKSTYQILTGLSFVFSRECCITISLQLWVVDWSTLIVLTIWLCSSKVWLYNRQQVSHYLLETQARLMLCLALKNHFATLLIQLPEFPAVVARTVRSFWRLWWLQLVLAILGGSSLGR